MFCVGFVYFLDKNVCMIENLDPVLHICGVVLEILSVLFFGTYFECPL